MKKIDEMGLLNAYFSRSFYKEELHESEKLFIGESFYLFIFKGGSNLSCSCVFDPYINFAYDSFFGEEIRRRPTKWDEFKDTTNTVFEWTRWVWDFDDKAQEYIQGDEKTPERRDDKGNLIVTDTKNKTNSVKEGQSLRSLRKDDGTLRDL